MSMAYLPNVSPANNNTQQMRRRVNGIVSQVSQQVGSIATGTGDLGTLNASVTTLGTTKANATNPALTGTITQAGATVATSATAGGATALPATPLGYLVHVVNGVTVKMPYYAV
jgi:hypothetical protein